MNPPKLSIIIITKDEEDSILECISSVKWADEIVVIDSGSMDSTVEICRSFGAKVHIAKDWQGFGKQKNRALALVSHEWVLSIDADERVSEALHSEIEETIRSNPLNSAFQISRSSSFCGQFINHSGWNPDYVTRLFKRGEAKFSDDIVHEKLITNCQIKNLSSPLIHLSYNNLEDVLIKLNRYSSDGAAMLLAKNKQTSVLSAVLRGLWAFLRTYILKLGILDGRMGFILAVYNAETTYYKYLKLMMLNNKELG
ncbi:glycosyltransferase family 2 protein [Methyloradius palustris]|uniref:glycosyltransferase family 2 protein n=1 Tax=Methyloradius palustris TaxID=2778876 RepID=UPI001C8C5418|nr:glycosyltransferase family 2 protein [Methyloradius palustris]